MSNFTQPQMNRLGITAENTLIALKSGTLIVIGGYSPVGE